LDGDNRINGFLSIKATTAKSSQRYQDIKQLRDVDERQQTLGSDIARSENE
jgi:hypothetical protein